MEITGKIIAVLPETSGQGKNGTWRSRDYVLETSTNGEQYPRKVCFNLFNDKIDKYPLAIDEVVTVSFDIESREYNGRWYTSVKAWKVEKNAVNAAPAAPQAASTNNASTNFTSFESANGADNGSDLPF